MKVHELLSTKDKWTQHAYARNAHGDPVEAHDESAVCWCLSGAITKCYPRIGEWFAAQSMLELALPTGQRSVTDWGDTHTYEEVKKLVEELDI